MGSQTSVENLLSQTLGLQTKKARNGSVATSASGYVALATDTPAQIVYISNPSTTLSINVKTNGVAFVQPPNTIFPYNHISNLKDIYIQMSDSSVVTITYRFEC